MPPPFPRTTCDCPECVQCCYVQPGSLHPGDFERIADALGEDREVAKLHFWASPGAVMGRITDVGGERVLTAFRVGTITPRKVDGRCVFLDVQDRCRVHEVAPFGCSFFDVHLSAEEGQRRSLWHMQGIMAEATKYQALRNELVVATSWTPRSAL